MKIAGIVVVAVLLGVLGVKLWPTTTESQTTQIKPPDGPAIILFRADDSASCNAIYDLVEQAKQRYQGRIEVIQTDWSTDNPLIEHYQIRFLPAVIFIDRQGNEKGRIVGESSAVQAQLTQALAQAEQLLLN